MKGFPRRVLASFALAAALAAAGALGARAAPPPAAAQAAPPAAVVTTHTTASTSRQSQTTGDRKAVVSKSCSDQADAKNLHGKARKTFRSACKRNGGTA